MTTLSSISTVRLSIVHAVCDVAQQHFFALCLGSIQLRAGGGQSIVEMFP